MEEQGLVVVKYNFITKITKFLKRIFRREKYNKFDEIGYLENENINEEEQAEIEEIEEDTEFVQEEILRARSAFRKYVINNTKNISQDILNYIEEKFVENESKIKKIIEINEDSITFEEIQSLIVEAKNDIEQFKMKDEKTECYKVPVGVIGIQTSDIKESIKNMLKSITTRNSIIILNENYSKYSTEALILLIIKDCLRNFYVDDDIVQMFEKGEIDLSKLDKIINLDDNSGNRDYSNVVYIYQEDNSFEDSIANEVYRLRKLGIFKDFEIKVISGGFGDIINFLNKNKCFAVCMYTNNSQRAYKFINWIDAKNVFINIGVRNCKNVANDGSDYFGFKYVLHDNIF